MGVALTMSARFSIKFLTTRCRSFHCEEKNLISNLDGAFIDKVNSQGFLRISQNFKADHIKEPSQSLERSRSWSFK
jgi:hypothetical protein